MLQHTRAERPKGPRDHDDLLTRSAVELAALIRDGAVSSLEVVDASIRRIEQVNPAINAVVATRFEAARAEARAADERGARDANRPPLHGVPCTIKEFLAVEGLPQTGGLVARRGAVATVDAVLVQRLRRAGVIVVGTTNVPEGGIWMETANQLYGRTNNPWDLTRTPGGSSGGEGAIVAAGGVPFGIGSDIGGSVRIPAAFCGTVGHKATGGLLPNTGQFPMPPVRAGAFLCHGPLTRRVRDVLPLLRILAGPDAGDPAARALPVGASEDVDLRGMVVYPIEDNGRTRVADVMRRGVRSAARALSDRGAEIREAKLPALRRGTEIFGAMLQEAADGERYEQILADGKEEAEIDPVRELGRLALGRSPHTLPALAVCLAARVMDRFPGGRARLVEECRQLAADLERLLGDRGVLLYPPYTRPAPRHHHALLTPLDAMHTAIFNPIGVPVTVVPVGADPRGLPVAVQIIAGVGRDHVSVAAGQALEDAFGGWRPVTPGAPR